MTQSWFIATQAVVRKEFALSGSEQNPDITDRNKPEFTRQRPLGRQAADPVEAFKTHGADFVVADTLGELVEGMSRLAEEAPPLDPKAIRRQIRARDLQMDTPYAKDAQVMAIHNARRSLAERLGRTDAPPSAMLPGPADS